MEGSRIPSFPGLKLCNFGVLLVSAHCFHKADSTEEITAHVSALAREARSPAACLYVWYTPSEALPSLRVWLHTVQVIIEHIHTGWGGCRTFDAVDFG